jgi:NADH-quinone oxidoreductase subunit M
MPASLLLCKEILRGLLAYSSIAHVGLISAGIFALNMSGLQGSLVQMVSHGLTVVGLFFCADIVFNRTQHEEVEGLGGIRLVAPQLCCLVLDYCVGFYCIAFNQWICGRVYVVVWGI